MIVFLANITVLILVGMLIRMLLLVYKSFVLLNAIYAYRSYCIKHWEKPKVDGSDITKFSDLVLNLKKWRYVDIIAADKFELVKPYIK
jgi:hypothetical protein